MSVKDWKNALGSLYDAMPKNPDGDHVYEEPVAEVPAWKPSKEPVYVYKDAKRRAGKTVTIVEGIQAPDEVLDDLGKRLKTQCGSGGSVKDGEIILQGDFKQKVKDFLEKEGFKVKLR